MLDKILREFLLFLAVIITLILIGCRATDPLAPQLMHIGQRLDEEIETNPSEPNSMTFKRATGQLSSRNFSSWKMETERVVSLDECLQMAFENNNQIKETRQKLSITKGNEIIVNSRFLPNIELIYQYEHLHNFNLANPVDISSLLFAQINQTILEYGKDNPLDINLRAEQRQVLFNYEDKVTSILSQVRRALFFIKLKEQQINTRQELLKEFKKQYEVKQQRMQVGNLSVKIEVLTAKLNVLNEETRINTLKRQMFNRKMDLLRLIGLPVGAEQVSFTAAKDNFALDHFGIDQMVQLALAQSSKAGFAEAVVAEQKRALVQLRYEYIPDLRLNAGYQDENVRFVSELINAGDTWTMDGAGQPKVPGTREERSQNLGLFSEEVTLDGPDPGRFAGLQVRIPLYEGGSRKGRKIRELARLKGFEAAFQDIKDEVELSVRQSYKFLIEQEYRVELAQENVNIEKERFAIKEKLRDFGKITDDELETFRNTFFTAQDSLFTQQETLIERQEDLRLAIRFFK
ncbi:MAG: TolC family protein [Planctomycetota bacterium]|jgi:outer membrane protein TolC